MYFQCTDGDEYGEYAEYDEYPEYAEYDEFDDYAEYLRDLDCRNNVKVGLNYIHRDYYNSLKHSPIVNTLYVCVTLDALAVHNNQLPSWNNTV